MRKLDAIRETNLALCSALGIDPNEVSSIHVEISTDAAPKVTVTRMLRMEKHGRLEHFELWPVNWVDK